MFKFSKSSLPLIIGYAFSLLCDVFMEFEGQTFLYAGILSNMAALIFYTLFLTNMTRKLHLSRLAYPAICLGAFFAAIYGPLGSFKAVVLIYCIFYSVFIWRALSLMGCSGVPAKTSIHAVSGSILITISDCILALKIFDIVDKRLVYSVLLMSCWWIGLFLLLLSYATMKNNDIAKRKTA